MFCRCTLEFTKRFEIFPGIGLKRNPRPMYAKAQFTKCVSLYVQVYSYAISKKEEELSNKIMVASKNEQGSLFKCQATKSTALVPVRILFTSTAYAANSAPILINAF